MISAIAQRYAPKLPTKPSLDLPVKAFGKSRAPGSKPLFESAPAPIDRDEELAFELQQAERGDEIENDQLARALEASREEYDQQRQLSTPHIDSDGDSMEEIVVQPSTNATPLDSPVTIASPPDLAFDAQAPEEEEDFEEVEVLPSAPRIPEVIDLAESSDEDSVASMQSAKAGPGPSTMAARQAAHSVDRRDTIRVRPESPEVTEPIAIDSPSPQPVIMPGAPPVASRVSEVTVRPVAVARPPSNQSAARETQVDTAARRSADAARAKNFLDDQKAQREVARQAQEQAAKEALAFFLPQAQLRESPEPEVAEGSYEAPIVPTELVTVTASPHQAVQRKASDLPTISRQTSLGDGNYSVYDSDPGEAAEDNDSEEEREIEWSKSPSPVPREATRNEDEPQVQDPLAEDDGGIDMVAEEDDYARFVAQIQNRDLDKVREEIDDEVRVLHAQQKVAMRDSEEITQAMILQTQVGPLNCVAKRRNC